MATFIKKIKMTKNHLMIIDPAVVRPAIESFNRISSIASYPITYHLPALYGTDSIKSFNSNLRGIIILGSAASVNESNNWQNDLSEIVINAASKNIPLLGICYGHQLIGHIFGGKVGPLWSGEKKQGKRIVKLEKTHLWGKPKSGPILYSHQDGIIKMPPGFDIIGKSELVSIDAIASTTKPIWGFQTHIEATQAFVNEHHIPVKNPKACFNFGQTILDQFILSL